MKWCSIDNTEGRKDSNRLYSTFPLLHLSSLGIYCYGQNIFCLLELYKLFSYVFSLVYTNTIHYTF